MLFCVNRLVSLPVLVNAVHRFSMFASTDINSSLSTQDYYWLLTNVLHTYVCILPIMSNVLAVCSQMFAVPTAAKFNYSIIFQDYV